MKNETDSTTKAYEAVVDEFNNLQAVSALAEIHIRAREAEQQSSKNHPQSFRGGMKERLKDIGGYLTPYEKQIFIAWAITIGAPEETEKALRSLPSDIYKELYDSLLAFFRARTLFCLFC